MVIAFPGTVFYICGMFIKQVKKKNSQSGKIFYQYQLTQTSRIDGKVKHYALLYLGAEPLLRDSRNRKMLARLLQAKIHNQSQLFEEGQKPDKALVRLAEQYYSRYLEKIKQNPESQASRPPESAKARYEEVDLESTRFESAREIGAERLGYEMLERLGIGNFLKRKGWDSQAIDRAKIAIIARAVFGENEHKTAQWLHTNSGLAELFQRDPRAITRHHLYKAALSLYDEKQDLERYLYGRSLDMFGLEDRLMIYDLTNTYFEGRKAGSALADFGRSKEKRNDCPQLVLGCVVNGEGFIRHSEIFRGNMADPSTLEPIVESLGVYLSESNKTPTLVMDAGIATEANLTMLRRRGLTYVCVSPRRLKDYQACLTEDPVRLKDSQDNELSLQWVEVPDQPDQWLYIKSQEKTRKEAAMDDKLMKRFEDQLRQVERGLHKRGGTKRLDKVYERIGRVKERNKTVHKYYDINVTHDGTNATGLTFRRKAPAENETSAREIGVYFIRTNHPTDQVRYLWDIYNTIREVEATFRCLKTDLNLRPIYHQNDKDSKAHLFLAIVAYQLVASIRYMLKQQGLNHDWTNIVRIMNSQKLVAMTQHTKTKRIGFKQTTRPNQQVLEIYKACEMSSMHHRLKKNVVYH